MNIWLRSPILFLLAVSLSSPAHEFSDKLIRCFGEVDFVDYAADLPAEKSGIYGVIKKSLPRVRAGYDNDDEAGDSRDKTDLQIRLGGKIENPLSIIYESSLGSVNSQTEYLKMKLTRQQYFKDAYFYYRLWLSLKAQASKMGAVFEKNSRTSLESKFLESSDLALGENERAQFVNQMGETLGQMRTLEGIFSSCGESLVKIHESFLQSANPEIESRSASSQKSLCESQKRARDLESRLEKSAWIPGIYYGHTWTRDGKTDRESRSWAVGVEIGVPFDKPTKSFSPKSCQSTVVEQSSIRWGSVKKQSQIVSRIAKMVADQINFLDKGIGNFSEFNRLLRTLRQAAELEADLASKSLDSSSQDGARL